MNKAIIVIIGIIVIAGAIFAFKNFYNPVKPESTPTPISQTPSPQQLPTSQGTTPPAQVTPTSTPTPKPKPTITKPPTTSSSVLDRIEAAIRAKLQR
jgi:cytoskeletal protein RodZ